MSNTIPPSARRFRGVPVRTDIVVLQQASDDTWFAKVTKGGLTDISLSGFASRREALDWAVEVAS